MNTTPTTLKQEINALYKTIANTLLSDETAKIKTRQPYYPAFQLFHKLDQVQQKEAAKIINLKIEEISNNKDKLLTALQKLNLKHESIINAIKSEDCQQADFNDLSNADSIDKLINTTIQQEKAATTLQEEAEILTNAMTTINTQISALNKPLDIWKIIKQQLKKAITEKMYSEKREQIKVHLSNFMQHYHDFIAMRFVNSSASLSEVKKAFDLELDDLLKEQDMKSIKELAANHQEEIDKISNFI